MKAKNLLLRSVAAAGLLMSGMAARAQQPPDRPYPQDRDRDRDRGDELDRFQDRVFSRLRADLDRAFSDAAPMEGDRGRIERARERLNVAQRMIRDRNFDRRAFDESFAAVQQVLEQNRMPEDARNDLRLDLRELHRLQDRLQQ